MSRFLALRTGLWLDLAAKPDTLPCMLAFGVELRHFVRGALGCFNGRDCVFCCCLPLLFYLYILGPPFLCCRQLQPSVRQWVCGCFLAASVFGVSERVARGEPVRRKPAVGHIRRWGFATCRRVATSRSGKCETSLLAHNGCALKRYRTVNRV